MGLSYGSSLQAIIALHLGNNQVLAQVRLPGSVADQQGDYVLHPSMMEGALQAAVGLLDGLSERSNLPRLLFALDSMHIISPCSHEMFAWVRYAPNGLSGDKGAKLDIDLCDESGNI